MTNFVSAVCGYGYVRLNQISSNGLAEGYSAAYVVHSHIQYVYVCVSDQLKKSPHWVYVYVSMVLPTRQIQSCVTE